MFFSDEQTLLIVIALIYITDCFFWVEKHSFAFIYGWGRNWKLSFPSVFFAYSRWGLLFINPLFPFITNIFQCHLFPVSFAPTGICAFNSQTLSNIGRPQQTGEFVEYKDISKVELNNNGVYINGVCFVKCKVIKHAKLIVDLLNEIIPLKDNERGDIIKTYLENLFLYKEAHELISDYRKLSLLLRILCFTWFVFMFIMFPILVWQYGMVKVIIPIALLTIYFAIIIAIEFYSLHKELFPACKEYRINNAAKMILCPPTAISANDKLTFNLISFFDPLCLGYLLLTKRRFAHFANTLILDLKYPIKLEPLDEKALAINSWHRRNLINICMEFLEIIGNKELKIFTPPNPLDTQSKSYCPRCLSQFKLGEGECPDCIGIKLISFGNIK